MFSDIGRLHDNKQLPGVLPRWPPSRVSCLQSILVI